MGFEEGFEEDADPAAGSRSGCRGDVDACRAKFNVLNAVEHAAR